MTMADTITESLGDTIEVQTPEVDAEIDVRDDDTVLYESDAGRLFVEAPVATVEVVPSADGAIVEPVDALPAQVTELEPADAREVQTDASVTEEVERYD